MFGNNSEFSCLMLMGFLSIAEYKIPDIFIVSLKSYQDLDPATNNICFWNQAWICFRPAQSKVQLGCIVFFNIFFKVRICWYLACGGVIFRAQFLISRSQGLGWRGWLPMFKGSVSDFQVWGLRSEGLPSFPGGVTVGHLQASVSFNHF